MGRLAIVFVLACAAVASGTQGAMAEESTPFEYRGIVEVSYGHPWSHVTRLDMFGWMADQGLNVYVHAAKDDPWQRANWRRPYPPDVLDTLLEEQSAAESAGVRWVPNISPALPTLPGPPAPGTHPSAPICFSCAGDLDVLVSKYAPFVESGASVLELSFDDVLMFSPWPQDWPAYGFGPAATGRMHRDLANAFTSEIATIAPGEPPRVIVVLAEYSGTRDSEYLRAVRAGGGLDAGIEVGWTGNDVAAKTITTDDAATYAALVGRDRIVLGDNYPTNDFTGPAFRAPAARIYLGPYVGRDPDLSDVTLGVVVNPMGNALASRVALATFADWAADPNTYDPEKSWRDAIDGTVGPEPRARDALAALAENSRSSILDPAESEPLEALVQSVHAGLDTGEWPSAAAALRMELDREAGAGAALHSAEPELATDLEPWLGRLGRNAGVAARSLDLLVSMRPSLDASASVEGDIVTVTGKARPPSGARVMNLLARTITAWAGSWAWPVVHGDRFTPIIGGVVTGQNRIDTLVKDTLARTARWLPRAPPAQGGLRVLVDGEAVPVGPDGSFETTIPVRNQTVSIEAVDGAGGPTRTELEI